VRPFVTARQPRSAGRSAAALLAHAFERGSQFAAQVRVHQNLEGQTNARFFEPLSAELSAPPSASFNGNRSSGDGARQQDKIGQQDRLIGGVGQPGGVSMRMTLASFRRRALSRANRPSLLDARRAFRRLARPTRPGCAADPHRAQRRSAHGCKLTRRFPQSSTSQSALRRNHDDRHVTPY